MNDYRQNPFQHAGLWYWYDEEHFTQGRYTTQNAALRALLRYSHFLENGPTLWQRMRYEWWPKVVELWRA